MWKIRYGFIVLTLLFCLTPPATAQVSVSIGLPHVSIGINLPVYPELVLVPGYPVYYAPQVSANYFFYDGYYWVFQDDYWYASDWYNGPWWLVEPDFVPLFILRIPVVYYRQPPQYFFGWQSYDPPRWGQHWGHDWEHRHRDWDHWQRDSTPPPSPRPDYQRQYSGKHYPRGGEQQYLHQRNYRYQPRDPGVRENVQPRIQRRGSSLEERVNKGAPAMKNPPREREQPTQPSRGGWSGPQTRQPPQEQRQPSVQDGRQPKVQDREQERDRQSSEYRSRVQEYKTPQTHNYERYGRGQNRGNEQSQKSGWGGKQQRERD